MTQYDLGQVVGADGQDGVDGSDGSTIWYTSTAPTFANSKYTFTISNLSGKTGFSIAVSDLIFYDTYYYIVSAVNSTTVDCATRVSIKGSDASVTVVDNLNSDSSTSVLSAKQGKVLNTNKIETSSIATSFGSTTSDSKVPSEKLVKTELDKKIATSSTTGLIKNDGSIMVSGTGSSNWAVGNHTHSAYVNPTKVTSWSGTPSDNNVASEKLIKDSLDDKVSKSSTSGLLKNDGTVDTTSYSTFDGNYNSLANKPTIPSASSTTPSADTTSGSYGSGTSYARSNHTHPKSSLYAEATHSHTKSQITDFPSLSTVATSGSYSDLSNKPSYTATITSSTTGAYEIGKINVSGSSQTIYGKDTGGSSVDIVTAWESTPSDSKVPSEKLVYDSIIGKIDDVSESGDVFYHDDSTNGHIYLFNRYLDFNVNDNSVKYNSSELATVSDIPSLTNYVQKSSTSGLLKNDGSVDTNTYLTSSAISGMLTTSDVVDNLTSTSATAPLSAKQGKVLNDLIGQAIAYINQ